MDNPPEGMTSKDIRNMSEDELLDMDFFLNEDHLFADEAGVDVYKRQYQHKALSTQKSQSQLPILPSSQT